MLWCCLSVGETSGDEWQRKSGCPFCMASPQFQQFALLLTQSSRFLKKIVQFFFTRSLRLRVASLQLSQNNQALSQTCNLNIDEGRHQSEIGRASCPHPCSLLCRRSVWSSVLPWPSMGRTLVLTAPPYLALFGPAGATRSVLTLSSAVLTASPNSLNCPNVPHDMSHFPQPNHFSFAFSIKYVE